MLQINFKPCKIDKVPILKLLKIKQVLSYEKEFIAVLLNCYITNDYMYMA